MFAQRLSRLRCAHSLLRLSDSSGYPQCAVAPMERKFSLLTRLRVQHVLCKYSDPRRGFAGMPVTNRSRPAVNLYNERRLYLDKVKENDYAHNLFLNSIHYRNTVMKPSIAYAYVTNEEALKILEKDWNTGGQLATNEEMVSMLKKLSYNIRCSKETIDVEMYRNFFRVLDNQCKNLSNDDLKMTMQHLMPFCKRFYSCDFYQRLCKTLDKQCMACFRELQMDDMLLICDTIYQIMTNPSEYMWYAVRKLGNKPNKLDRHYLVQILFLLNVCRKPPINMYELEYRLEQCLDDLSINEIGVASLGFFKTGSKIRSISLLRRIMRKTIANMDAIDTSSIAAIMKLIRFSMQLTEIALLQELLQSVMPHVPRFQLMTLTHIAHACAKVSVLNEELMDKMIQRLNSEIKTARLKDIERFAYVFANLNIDPNNSIYQTIINELRNTWDTDRAKEISIFPQVASRILGYLAVSGVYPIDLIKRVMMPDFLSSTCRHNHVHLTREYCVLDYSLRVEVPEYDGPRLKPVTSHILEKKYFQEFYESSMRENSRMKLLLTEVVDACKEMFSATNISVGRPLPHYSTPDIILCLDKSNKLVPSDEFLSQFDQGEIMRIDKNSDDVRWIALVLAHHGLLITNNGLPVGHLAAKLRQLPKIGYTPIWMSHIQWSVCRTIEDKCNYIKQLIDASNLSNT